MDEGTACPHPPGKYVKRVFFFSPPRKARLRPVQPSFKRGKPVETCLSYICACVCAHFKKKIKLVGLKYDHKPRWENRSRLPKSELRLRKITFSFGDDSILLRVTSLQRRKTCYLSQTAHQGAVGISQFYKTKSFELQKPLLLRACRVHSLEDWLIYWAKLKELWKGARRRSAGHKGAILPKPKEAGRYPLRGPKLPEGAEGTPALPVFDFCAQGL